MTAPSRSFSFFLHGHLPWVLPHGRWPHGAEWLCEAAIATYLPLVAMLRRLRDRGIKGGVTLSVSPVLAEQLSSPSFRELFDGYLRERARTSREEARSFEESGQGELSTLARRWETTYRETRDLFFGDLQCDLIGALRDLEESGVLEIATCAATHGYLPLLGRDESIALQIELARSTHERHFGRAPRGIWLPEAAYRPSGPWSELGGDRVRSRPGIEEFLSRAGFDYFMVDSALLMGGQGAGSYPQYFGTRPDQAIERVDETLLPYWIARDEGAPDVAFFGRDERTALQVWSGEHGYPGDPAFLEFHKKSEGGGHRYWRVTGPHVDLGDKGTYRPEEALERASWQADHFRDLVADSLAAGPPGSILVAPYDAELFGHWWYEGVLWMENVLGGLHANPGVRLTTLAARLDDSPPARAVRLPEGSWGKGGGHEVWRNPQVDWSWRLIYPLESEVWNLWSRYSEGGEDARRVLRLAATQLLLLCSSDWQFLITTGTAADYATNRLQRHADDLARLTEIGRRIVDGGAVEPEDREFLVALEQRDPLFPDVEDTARRVAESFAPVV